MLATSLKNSTSIYSSSPLSDTQIMAVAPSVYAQGAHESRSDRYSYIPTGEILKGLRKEGFLPFFAAQSRSRIEGKAAFTKHLLRLRRETGINKPEAFEIILLNSHDGTSSYQLIAGTIKFLCLNRMVTGNIETDVRVPHKGNVMDRVIEGAYEVLSHQREVEDSIDSLKTVRLLESEKQLLAETAATIRYEDNVPISPEHLLRPRRFEDNGSDLWSVHNVVQENLIRGGLRARTTTGRNTTTRAVQSIDTDTKLNRALWEMTQKFYALKSNV